MNAPETKIAKREAKPSSLCAPVGGPPEAGVAIGDRASIADFPLWAVFDRPHNTCDYTLRRLAFDLALHGCDLALPDVSYSELHFGLDPAWERGNQGDSYADMRSSTKTL